MKIAYIAQPYAYLLKFGLNAPIEYAKDKASIALKAGFIPLSPVLAFNGIYNEATQRKLALSHAIFLMKKCDVFCLSYQELSLSEGMRNELEIWKQTFKPIYDYEDLW